MTYNCLELCAGAGGQALGFESAGLTNVGLVEIDRDACSTLRFNRPEWNVIEADLKSLDLRLDSDVDIIAAGVPCPPFSVAGKQLGGEDERDLFPHVVKLAQELAPRAVIFENVRGLLTRRFDEYRQHLEEKLSGYSIQWRLLNAADFDVPQNRLRAIGIALREDDADYFRWPAGSTTDKTVGSVLHPLMASNGWIHADDWAINASGIAPTLVGGSRLHGGADLGPTRAREIWRRLGVDGLGLADRSPDPDFKGVPKLTLAMAAKIQGFPESWVIQGKKTAAYRQVGNALPPPLAQAVAESVSQALSTADRARIKRAS